jgi:two-component system copper resistance phosphate regulon response regulator CusR
VATVTLVLDWGSIRLPARESLTARFDSRKGTSPGFSAETDPRGEGLRILMVEDDDALALMYRVRLEAAGYTVVVATDGEHGLRLAQEGSFDLVFLDIGLPGMDGLSVLEAMRKQAELQATPVVILSNYNEPPMRQRGMRLGAISYLVKSEITPSGLVARIPGWTRH